MTLFKAIILATAFLAGLPAAHAADDEPWKDPRQAIVLDAYELNILDWEKLFANKRIAGFISKASDGLPEVYDCSKPHKGDTTAHCKTMWRKYAVSRELYQTRRLLARQNGLLWGAYHLARPGNPIDQANHFLDYARPSPDDLMAIDIEGLDSEKYMSLEDAEIFVGHIKARTGRYPVLYTNHDTAKLISLKREEFPVLSRLPLWYARYKPEIKGVFPMGHWESYFLWQFSSIANCDEKACPMRIDGAQEDIDVNATGGDRQMLARAWTRGDLLPERPPALQYLVSAKGALGVSHIGGASYTVSGREQAASETRTAQYFR